MVTKKSCTWAVGLPRRSFKMYENIKSMSSAILPPVAPVDIGAPGVVKPAGGSQVTAVSGETIAITSPEANFANPVVVVAPASGTLNLAPATQGANVVVTGEGSATLNIGTADNGGTNSPLNLGGSTVQVDENYKGRVVANFSGAVIDGVVNKATDTGVGSIANNAPANAGNFNFYINTGSGDDAITGTVGNDFIRAGAGNDVIFSGAGNDVVRVGAGNDTMALGTGDDILYLTVDQLQGQSTNTIIDFDGASAGDDKIQIDADLVGRVSIAGQGTNRIVITLSGSQTGVTTIVSEAGTIDNDDIQFV